MTARRRCSRATGLGMCLLLAGCSALQLNPLTQSRPVERDPTPGLPGKHSARVSQFVFFADFEVPRHQPIIRDLSPVSGEVIVDDPPGGLDLQPGDVIAGYVPVVSEAIQKRPHPSFMNRPFGADCCKVGKPVGGQVPGR